MEKNIRNVVLKNSAQVDLPVVAGYDFNDALDYSQLLKSLKTTGYQATNFGLAIDTINQMIESNSKIFLGYTSNLISSGLRDIVRFLVQHKMVHCIVATAGGIEEDLIKCLGNTHVASFSLDGAKLRSEGLNRIGNLLVPNDNYCKFEDWVMPILDTLLNEQNQQNTRWTPSAVIHRLGKEINDPSSVYYWCYKNDIPVYCPAITDGSLGDMIYFHTFKNPGIS
jgi:deoxyhypusine synthase